MKSVSLRDYRLAQLNRLEDQVRTARKEAEAGVIHPLLDHLHPRSLSVGDFVIVDLKDDPELHVHDP